MSDADDKLADARADVYHARRRLSELEAKALASGNYDCYQMELDVLRRKRETAEAYLSHIESKHDVAFGGVV